MRTEEQIGVNWNNASDILVSITCIAYNHELYIEDAIKGFLMQVTTFPFELIIHDDASTDDTQKIIIKYQSSYPNLIISILQSENHWTGKGINATSTIVWPSARGKYIAWCEGDDYWTDPLKLQKQVDFLEANEEYVIHSGKAQILQNNEFKEVIGNPLLKNKYNQSDFLTKNNLITCTVMFKNSPINSDFFKNVLFSDWMLYVMLLSKNSGNLAYASDEIYSVYRIHPGGIMQTLAKKYDIEIAHLRQIISIKKSTTVCYDEDDIKQINYYGLSIFKHCILNKKYIESFDVFFKNLFLTKSEIQLRKYLSILKHNF